MLKLNDNDLKAIAYSRADKGKHMSYAQRIFMGIIGVWILFILLWVAYEYFHLGYSMHEISRYDDFTSRLVSSMAIFIFASVFAYWVTIWVRSRQIFRQLKAEYKKKK